MDEWNRCERQTGDNEFRVDASFAATSANTARGVTGRVAPRDRPQAVTAAIRCDRVVYADALPC
jgi:hypothetical protein